MKLTSFQWMAAGLMLSAAGVGASIHYGSSPAVAGTTIKWTDTTAGQKEVGEHAVSHNYAK